MFSCSGDPEWLWWHSGIGPNKKGKGHGNLKSCYICVDLDTSQKKITNERIYYPIIDRRIKEIATSYKLRWDKGRTSSE